MRKRILNKFESFKIVYKWNQTDKFYPEDKTIYELFEAQVEKNPDNKDYGAKTYCV